jgi:hypothetical protein
METQLQLAPTGPADDVHEAEVVPELVAQRPLFDYSFLDVDSQIKIRLLTSEINSIAKRMASDVVEIGGKLAEVKDRLGSGDRFKAYLEAELGWSERQAYNFMAVWQKFANANFSIQNIATSALYLLAAASTPASAVENVKQLVAEGHHVSHDEAKTIIEIHKQAEAEQSPPLFEPLDEEASESTEGETASEVVEEVEQPRPAPKTVAVAASAKPIAPSAKISPEAREIEKVWGAATIKIGIQLMPAKGGERKAMLSLQANDRPPVVKMLRADDLLFIGRGLEEIEQFKRKLPKELAKKALVKPAPAKPTAKKNAKGGKK